MFSWQEQYHSRSLCSLVRYCSCHSNIKFISSRHRVISSIYYMATIVRALLLAAERALFSFIIWLAPRAGKMNQIVRYDWLPERARWSHLARSGLPDVSRKQNFTKSHIINPLLTKFVRSRWLDIGLVLFCEFMDLDFVSGHKHAKKELGQYPAILTSHLVNNPYIMPYKGTAI